jgi:hypothetical protein
MKKLVLAALVIALATPSCRKPSSENNATSTEQRQLVCGTDHTGNSLPAFFRQQLMQQRLTSSTFTETLLYLDMDGEIVRPGTATVNGNINSFLVFSTRFCPAPTLTQQEKDEVVRLVGDDFAPFNIVVTTDRTAYDAYAPNRRMACIVTTLPSVIGMPPNVQGVAPFFGNGSIFNQPCFVFADAITTFYGTTANKIVAASTASQEVGHLFGLDHQHVYSSECQKVSEYHGGSGSGLLGFAPIMGAADKRVTTWWDQPCGINDFNYLNTIVALRGDDHPDVPGAWTDPVSDIIPGTLGVANDVDFIFLRPLSPVVVEVTADNIDLEVSWCSPNGAVISTFNDPADLGVTIPRIAGLGFLKIKAASNANLDAQFMTGNYKVRVL